ncbi:hypothetical protein EMIHUDRAFT_354309 [Emiliania huxleyi CCMP1516]|uniref:Uncharacterized protein n=2 Tax=Emiliania huxleyi TaxID=2903 RepID=A0A0D3JNZ4_EMIH1|nr:hypothetical protein EMIHUDRAFT_354309 [Emiliania huxleyi CCMP1516]EOD25229.1 hypothetical protein EMIHUDRAFT_354309 [Emiliania huxleyi CCMP1516]|eukprot:XP_005777658.1 hypothetical protein EMIHUDRAFT_354309 [Emiliania huxleyi CCMP1516]
MPTRLSSHTVSRTLFDQPPAPLRAVGGGGPLVSPNEVGLLPAVCLAALPSFPAGWRAEDHARDCPT